MNKKISTATGIITIIVLAVIIIGGVFAYQYYWPNLEKEQEEQQEEINTSDWETYRNDEVEYEIKYPKDWKVDDFASYLSDNIDIYKDFQGEYPYQCDLSITCFEKKSTYTSKPNDYVTKDSKHVCRIDYYATYADLYNMPNGPRHFYTEECDNIFKQMLSTFKFID